MAAIKEKSQRDFRLQNSNKKSPSLDFNKMLVGNKTLANDVTANLSFYDKNTTSMSREKVERAIKNRNVKELRLISNYFFERSGIYSRLCRYVSYLYRYDFFVVPIVYDKKIKDEKIVEGWYKSCDFLESCSLKKNLGKIALKVVKNGCYYGYKVTQKGASFLQELPVDYCRSRYELNGKPAVEFNIKYFDDTFSDAQYRLKVLKMFPKEFQKAYISYKNGNLPRDFQGDDAGWFLLETDNVVKFNISNSDIPLFIPVIPAILDLEDAKELDKQKMKQQLLKIIVQKMPIDNKGELIFDVAESQQLHANAVQMVGSSIGVDVLTTFADVDEIDLSDTGTKADTDQLERVERAVYNEAGVSQMQFNTDGNLALEKSIANDEATMLDLLLQFEEYLQSLLKPFNKNEKRLKYRVQMLPTTIYNYKDLAKTYKEQTMLGYSKLYPQVALGLTQTSIIASAIFENNVLHLEEVFVPPQMSSTMSGNENKENSNAGSGKKTDNPEGGRPELADDQKSTKTIQNKEAEG